MSPMDAINYIVALRKSNLDDITTGEINDVNLCTFNEENRFNEEISFREGELGHSYTLSGITYVESPIANALNSVYNTLPSSAEAQTTYYNVYELEAPQALLDAIIDDTIADGYPRFTFTQASPTEPKLENFSVDAPSVLSSPYYETGTTKTYTPIFEEENAEYRLSEDINPVLVGTVDLSEGINIATNNQLKIVIDGTGYTIDLSGLSNTINLTTLISEINSVFTSIGKAFASQRFGLTIYNTSDFITSEIMNQDEDNYYLALNDGTSPTHYTISAGTTQTYAQLLSNINTALGSTKYSARFVSVYDSALETTTCADIEIYNNGTITTGDQDEDPVIIELATTAAYDLLAALGTEADANLRTTYQENYDIASSVDGKYLKLEIDGTVNNYMSLIAPTTADLTADVLGLVLAQK